MASVYYNCFGLISSYPFRILLVTYMQDCCTLVFKGSEILRSRLNNLVLGAPYAWRVGFTRYFGVGA